MTTEDEAGWLSTEIETLQAHLVEQEAEWPTWRTGNAYLTSQHRSEGLQEVRDKIYKMQARLARLKR